MKKIKTLLIAALLLSIFCLPALAAEKSQIIDGKDLSLIKITAEKIPEILNLRENEIISSQIMWLDEKPYYVITSKKEISGMDEIKIYNLSEYTVNASSGEIVKVATNRFIKKDEQEIFERPQEMVVLHEDGFIYIYNILPEFKDLIKQKAIARNIKPLLNFSVIDLLRNQRMPNTIYKSIIKTDASCHEDFLKETKMLWRLSAADNYNIYAIKAKLPKIKEILWNDCLLQIADESGINYFIEENPELSLDNVMNSFKESSWVVWKDKMTNKFWSALYRLANLFDKK